MARVGEIALVEKPADEQLPPRIDCYRLVYRSASGAAFKLDPARLVYSLQWRHIGIVNMTLLAELRRRVPHAIDWSPLQDDVAPMVDAFEAAQDGRVT